MLKFTYVNSTLTLSAYLIKKEGLMQANDEQKKEILFESLYEKHYKNMLKYAYAYFKHNKRYFYLAENAVQDTFFIAHKNYDDFSNHPNQAGWLFTVLKYILYDYMQKIIFEQKHKVSLNEDILLKKEQETDAIEQFLQNEENRRIVQKLMQPLNEKERRITQLYYFEQKSSKEIAIFYNTSDRVVNTQLYRIRKK